MNTVNDANADLMCVGATSYRSWLSRMLVNAKGEIISQSDSIDNLSKAGVFSVVKNVVNFGCQQQFFLAAMKHLSQSYRIGVTSTRYFLVTCRSVLPVIVVVSTTDVEGVERISRQGAPCLFWVTFVGNNCGQIDLSAFREIFGLTSAETRVLEGICRGRPLEEIAFSMSCKVGGVRFHIKNIFQKTGVRKQAELVSLALNFMFSLDV